MNGLNQSNIIGNVTRDAELTLVDVNGVKTPRCKFSVAVDETRSNGENIVTYFDVTVWREYATKLAPHILKGRKVHVTGSVRLNQYTKNNTTRTSLQIHNATVTLLDRKPNVEVEDLDDVDELPFG